MCGKRVLAKASNTTNLFQHLCEHHPAVYAELGPRKQPKRETSTVQPTLGSVVMKSALYSSGSSQAKDMNRAVAYHIAKDAVPLSTVDKPGFWFMVSKLNSRYQLPSPKHFSDHTGQNIADTISAILELEAEQRQAGGSRWWQPLLTVDRI